MSNKFLNQTSTWIQTQIPFDLPKNIKLKQELHKEENVFYGHTKMQKIRNQIKITITIHISNSLLKRKGIQEATKKILVHEFCHVLNPFHPDKVMKLYFPDIWNIWEQCQKVKALECDTQITEISSVQSENIEQ